MKPPPPPTLHISLSNRQRHLRLDRKSLLEFLRAAAKVARLSKVETNRGEAAQLDFGKSSYDLSVALVDDATIAELNQRFLNHTGSTDVLAFNLASGLGEIIVSAERAVLVARQLRRPPAAELALYLVHGLLHLAGYDDATPAQRRAMRRAEHRTLAALRERVNSLGQENRS